MTGKKISQQHQATVDGIRHTDEEGNEYWLARELAPLLEYVQWRNFMLVVDKARMACQQAGNPVADHFADISKMVGHGVSGLLAGHPGLIHHEHEVAPLHVFQQRCQFASQPVFVALFVRVANAIDGRLMLLADFLPGHSVSPRWVKACASSFCGRRSISASCAATIRFSGTSSCSAVDALC